MRRVLWVVKIAVLVAASYCIFSPGGAVQRARAEGGSCDTSTSCRKSYNSDACYCPIGSTEPGGCAGCFVRNNDTGCGVCSKGELELE
jgi:hypothetical protein